MRGRARRGTLDSALAVLLPRLRREAAGDEENSGRTQEQRQKPARGKLVLPGMETRKPARNVLAILVVVGAEGLSKCGFLVEKNK